MIASAWKQMAALPMLIACGSAIDARAQSSPPSGDEIVVQAELEKAERQVEALTREITRRPRTDKPISKRYSAVCVGVYGLSADFAHVLISRIEENARTLGIHVLGEGCQVNTLVAFTNDSRAEIERLRKAEPWLFETLLDYEYDRILRGNGAAQAWHSTQVKGADGKPLRTEMLPCPPVCPPREAEINDQAFASNISQQLRVDIEGSIAVFDNAHVPGKSIQQLADYATMRLFAPTDDVSNGAPGEMSTILSLFAEDGDAPDGLTAFDRAYLGALYKLPATARGAAIHDATWAAYRQGRYEIAGSGNTD